tara:strand:+ start:2953 stop:4056 length:1104 start_codon:yes stop_codon:yes gene_type:complete
MFATDCRKFIINLDDPIQTRWDHIIPHFKEKIPLAIKLADEMLGNLGPMLVEPMLIIACKTNQVLYADEIRGIAKSTGLSTGKIIQLQLAYEAFAACTSVVVNTPKGPTHVRTMDWAMPILKKLTIQVDFKQNNKTVFTGTTWAGYIGILTGMRPNSFSVSINYRQTREGNESPCKAFIRNIYRCITGKWPVGYIVRETLMNAVNYNEALFEFQQAELIAPTYITICGIKKDEGAIITRNRDPRDMVDGNIVTELKDGNLVQANMDHCLNDKFSEESSPTDEWENICESRARHKFVTDVINNNTLTEEILALLMATEPCYSPALTIYTSLMIPRDSRMETRVDISKTQTRKGSRKFRKEIKNSLYKF